MGRKEGRAGGKGERKEGIKKKTQVCLNVKGSLILHKSPELNCIHLRSMTSVEM